MEQTSRRGRPPKEQVSREEANKPQRPERVSMGATLKLEFAGIQKDPGYHYRVFSDRDGRIDQAQQAWYEFVKDKDGNPVSRSIGAYKQYLMRIEKKYHEQDQALKLQKTVDTLKVEQKLESDEYIPDGNHHALQKDDYDPLG